MPQTIAKPKRIKKGSARRDGWINTSLRAHIPGLIEEVQAIFREDHNIHVSPSDVLTNALKAYKEKLRPA